MTPPADESAWTRLGRLLSDRRTQLAARYRNKTLFSQERQIHRRMLWAVESGARDTYTPDTIRAIEAAYMLVPGSLRRSLDGGELEPAPGSPGAPPLRAAPDAPPGATTSPADDILADLLAGYPDDPVVASLATQKRKAARVIVNEILEWLEFLADRDGAEGNGTTG